ncbi:hypothetical protein V5F77_02305 [Xanthobacter sp. DSM 24535]
MDDDKAAADYIASHTEELRRLALARGLLVLAYVLDMAKHEAERILLTKK